MAPAASNANAGAGCPIADKPRAQLVILTLGCIALVIMCVTSIWLAARTQSDADWIEHAIRVQSRLSELELLVSRAEQAQRAHLLTGDASYLGMYRVALDAIPPALADLESAASENPSLREPFAALKALIGQKIDQLRDTMRLHESNEHSAALASLADEQRSSLTRASVICSNE